MKKSIRIPDENDHLKLEVYEIMDLVKEYDACIATGHISMGESIVLCREAGRRRVRTVLTHPDWGGTFIPCDVQKELTYLGVFIEKLWFDVGMNHVTVPYMADVIRDVGAEHCYLSTDRGQTDREYPAEGMMMFLDCLLDCGMREEDLYTMTHTVPQKVLGICM